MITIKDWVADIPEEDKHIAYVGEHDTVQRQFLLTGEDADTYKGWTFRLDMRFDLSTVTKTSTRQTERVEEEQSETTTETVVNTTATSQRESATVTDVEVDCTYQTDVAYLTQEVRDEGLLLTWHILTQQTQLPGRLWATLRAVNANGKVKKSAMMVFAVDPAVEGEPAAIPPVSEFEEMEQRMDERVRAIEEASQWAWVNADDAKYSADEAYRRAVSAVNSDKSAKEQAANAQNAAQQAANDAAAAAQSAAAAAGYTSHPPIIGESGNWMQWNGTVYVDTGLTSRGEAGPRGDTGLPDVVYQWPASNSLLPNVEYRLGTVDTLHIQGFGWSSGNKADIWSVQFKAGESISVTVPDMVHWYAAQPAFTPGNTYMLTFLMMANYQYTCVWVEVTP